MSPSNVKKKKKDRKNEPTSVFLPGTAVEIDGKGLAKLRAVGSLEGAKSTLHP